MNGATQRPRRQWIALLVTTFLGVAATVGVGWYQLSKAEKQAFLAEQERARSVRQSLVSIVEEHVLNNKPIDSPRLVRLIDQRRREEHVATLITVSEVLEQAEFNILNSRYLTFERKQALKMVFDSLYSDLGTRAFAPFPPDLPNADLLNTLARQIQDGKSSQALESLKRLQQAHAKELQEIIHGGWRPIPFSDIISQIGKNPPVIMAIMVIYILVMIPMIMRLRPGLVRIIRSVFEITDRREKHLEKHPEKISDKEK